MSRLKPLIFKIITLLLVASFLTAAAPTDLAAVNQNLTFLTVADAFVTAANPGLNFGKVPVLRAFPTPLSNSYLRFNVTGLAGRSVIAAYLWIHALTGSTNGLVLKAVPSVVWGETTLTFNNAPPVGKVLASVPKVTAGAWVVFNVSAYVTHTGLFSFAVTKPALPGVYLSARESVNFVPRLILVVNNDPVLVGAGDIASCDSTGDEATANLIAAIPGTVFTAGDNVYESGTASEFSKCYNPSWGRFKARTHPVPGNHDYNTSNGAGYFGYFGAAAGIPGKGYYSFNLGTWHIVMLNGEINHAAGSPQEVWLRQDLATHPAACTLAIWHEPLFSSGSTHGSNPDYKAFWQALYTYHADVVVNGHEHNYERFAPQTPAGVAAANGIREFVAGMGGRSHYPFGKAIANSLVRNGDTYGVIKFTLHANSYDWKFIPVAGKTFSDSGSALCNP
jgi:hypothetical protein